MDSLRVCFINEVLIVAKHAIVSEIHRTCDDEPFPEDSLRMQVPISDKSDPIFLIKGQYAALEFIVGGGQIGHNDDTTSPSAQRP